MWNFFELFDWPKFLAWLAILLFGLQLLENSVSNIWETTQNWIKKYTKWKFKSIIMWIVVTAILQSSTVVSLIITAFVGTGVIGLVEWVGMMIWANIGTTFLDNIMAFLSFESGIIDIKKYIFVIMWVSGILWFFFKSKKALFDWLFWLSIIFLGIDYIKSTMTILTQIIDLNAISHYNMIVFVLIWVVVTAAIRSSSSVILMSITALNAWVINLPIGFAIMIWANIWTCITALQWAIGKNSLTKRIAYSHLFFNIFTAIIFGIFFKFSIYIFSQLNSYLASILHYHLSDEKTLMLFIGWFDIIGAIALYPFIWYFVKFLILIFPDKVSQNIPMLYIDKINGLTWKYAMESLTKDIQSYYERCKKYNLDQIQVHHWQDNAAKYKEYNDLKTIYEKIIKYISNLDQVKLSNESNTTLLQNIMNDSFYSVKYLEDIDHNIYKLYLSNEPIYHEYFDYFSKTIDKLYILLLDYNSNQSAIAKLLSDIKIDDQFFINKFVDKNNWVDDINWLSDIITIHKYYFISCEDMVEACQKLSKI